MVSERWDAWLRTHVGAIDTLLTAALMIPLALPLLATGNLLAFVGSLGLLAPLAWRRLRPGFVTVVVGVEALAQWWIALQIGGRLDSSLQGGLLPADLAVLIAVYSAAAYSSRWVGRVAGLAGIGGAALATYSLARQGLGQPPVGVIVFGGLATSVIAAWAFGSLRRVRLAQVEALRERTHLLEVERDQSDRLAAAAERARIAREMHDVVAHSLAVVIAQADGGRYAARSSPQSADAALATIADTGRRALAEMRGLLGVLRSDRGPTSTGPITLPIKNSPGAGPPVEQPPGESRLPQPGIHDVAGMVEQLTAGGLRVTLTVEGRPREISAGVGLAAYRIVQEGLTNVLKHAGPAATADVSLRWAQGSLVIGITDDGRGAGAAPPGPGGGHGLTGMRERAALYGGDFSAGPRPGGGFAVRAALLTGSLPTPDASGAAVTVSAPAGWADVRSKGGAR